MFSFSTKSIQAALAGMGATPKQAAQVARGVGAAAFATWKQMAQNELHASARDYMQGLQLEHANQKQVGWTSRIVLNGTVPNMIEQGWPGGNMRAWMLKSPKAKSTKDGGKYLVVPYRHGVPSTKGRNVGNPMPKDVYGAAKQLAPTFTSVFEPTSLTGRLRSQTTWGGRLTRQGLSALELSPKARQKVQDRLNELKRPWHTTSIWTGMIRNEAQYEKAKQSSYATFRTISSRSRDPRSWMHPGITARHFATRTQDKISGILTRVMLQVLRGKKNEPQGQK